MLALTVIPLALFAQKPSRLSVIGGLFQDFAPSAFHTQKVLLPLLEKMGGSVRMRIIRPGYIPKGKGHLSVEVEPVSQPLKALHLMDQGRVTGLHGLALSSHLERACVSERMADRCRKILQKDDYPVNIETIHDSTAVQKGAALALWAETSTEAVLGADLAGKPGRKSESIAHSVASALMEDLCSGATTDRHAADQLILFGALAQGTTEYLIPRVTDHVKTNLWLVRELLGIEAQVQDNRLMVDGVGLNPSRR
jgi:RNA 3'-terminal phosphate cyclase (ATP)